MLLGLALAAAASLQFGSVTMPTLAALPMLQVAGRGAEVGFVEYEAENAAFDGELIGPSRRFTTLASEASGRRAVRLTRQGQYVEFTLASSANAITVRYAIPDAPDGRGLKASVGIYSGNERLGTLRLTSRYGWFYGRYPFTNLPKDGSPHHFYDEARLLLNRTLPAGARLRLVMDEARTADWVVVDLADLEHVPPPSLPPRSALSIERFGADPSGRKDSYAAIRAAIAAARRKGREVWIPAGTYRVDRHVEVDRVTISGAGPWYSVVRGMGVGFYGKRAPRPSTRVTLRDFAIIGEVTERVDRLRLAGVGGALGGGSVLSNLWIQHHKTGVWLDGPFDGITIRRLRILDNSADGLNLHRGVTNALVEQNFVRNSGDDGLALWSSHEPDRSITLRNNTVIAPMLANGIAAYGGRDIAILGNLVADTVTEGGGIHLGNRFASTPLAGQVTIENNLVVRSGSFDPHWRVGIGALWFYALDVPIKADIRVEKLDLIDSTLPAIQFVGKSISSVRFSDLRIERAHHVLQIQSAGSASFSGVLARNVAAGGVATCHEGFTLSLLAHAETLSALPPVRCDAVSGRRAEELVR